METRRFAAHLVKGQQMGQRAVETIAREFHPDYDLLTLRYYEGSGGRLSPHELRGGVSTSARYRITVEASGHNQKHAWDELVKTDQSKSFLIGLHMADTPMAALPDRPRHRSPRGLCPATARKGRLPLKLGSMTHGHRGSVGRMARMTATFAPSGWWKSFIPKPSPHGRTAKR